MNFEIILYPEVWGPWAIGGNSECNLKKDERLNYCLSVFDSEQLIN